MSKETEVPPSEKDQVEQAVEENCSQGPGVKGDSSSDEQSHSQSQSSDGESSFSQEEGQGQDGNDSSQESDEGQESQGRVEAEERNHEQQQPHIDLNDPNELEEILGGGGDANSSFSGGGGSLPSSQPLLDLADYDYISNSQNSQSSAYSNGSIPVSLPSGSPPRRSPDLVRDINPHVLDNLSEYSESTFFNGIVYSCSQDLEE